MFVLLFFWFGFSVFSYLSPLSVRLHSKGYGRWYAIVDERRDKHWCQP